MKEEKYGALAVPFRQCIL